MVQRVAELGSADPETVLDGLDPEQREVATTLGGPLCVLAGAGTGKTRAITHRIAYGVHNGAYDARTVLAVTFTTRAAGEMRARLRGLGVDGVQARTFHSAALRQSRWFWPRVMGSELPPIVESKLALLREAVTRCRLGSDAPLLRDLAGEVEWAKVSNVTAEGYAAAATAAGRSVGSLDAPAVGRIYASYEQVKAERGRIDLEDVLLSAVGLLETYPGVAEQVRGQYRHLVVDEYQDVSPLQQRLLEAWLGDRQEVCVVGDPAQTIYSFAGARWEHLLEFPLRHPGAAVVRLVRDYRSTPQVVSVANAVLSAATGPAAPLRLALEAQRPPGPAVTYAEHPDEVAEAGAVARAIHRLVQDGTPPREVAVLYRVNAQSQAYEQALAQAGVPYVVRGADRFFDRPEVRQATLLARGAARAGEGSGDLVADLGDVLAGLGWSAGQPPPGPGAVRERWESLSALSGLAAEVAAAQPEADLAAFVAELEARAAAQHAPLVDGVTLASLHAAKGLEWDAVFIVGCHEGTLPIVHAATPAQVEEERRLLYVGITRARTRLSLSWSVARAPGGRGRRSASRFLDGVRPVDGDGSGRRRPVRAATGAGRGTGARSVARCRVCHRALASAVGRKLGRCPDCPVDRDEELFESLRSWRLARAAEQRVPAYCVFTDATLTAIAETRPGDAAQLAAVPGVGRTKLDRYGAEVLALCRTT